MKLRKKANDLEGVKITPDFGIDQAAWPQWLITAWRVEQPMADGTIPPGMIVPDIGGEVRVGGPVVPEIGRTGDWIIRDSRGNLGVATEGFLFNDYEIVPGSEEVPEYAGDPVV
jgi:hypothetical protein